MFWKTDAIWFTLVKCFHTTSMTKNRIVPQLILRAFCHLICLDKSHIYAYHQLILPVPSWKHLLCHFSLLILLAQEFQICLLLSHIFSLHRSTRYKWKFNHFRYLFRTVTFPVEVKRRNLKNCCAALPHWTIHSKSSS